MAENLWDILQKHRQSISSFRRLITIFIGLDKIINYIEEEGKAECREIYQKAAEQCQQLNADYSRIEQEEYWKYINVASKKTERRRTRLDELAAMESKKKLLETQQEMVDEAFALAAKKLLDLPKKEYSKICVRLAMGTTSSPEDIVGRFRSELSLKIVSVLFD